MHLRKWLILKILNLTIKVMNEFRREVLKVDKPRKSKETKTLNNYQIYSNIIKKNPYLSYIDKYKFVKIIRKVNQLLAEELLKYGCLQLPLKLGKLIISVYESKILYIDKNLIRTTHVNWDKTLDLWENNDKAKEKKTLVRDLPQNIYRVRWIREGVKNTRCYTFKTCRSLKLKLKEKINKEGVPAYEYGVCINK